MDPILKSVEAFKRTKLKEAVLDAKEDLEDKRQNAVEFYELHELGELPEITKVEVAVREVENKLVEKTKAIFKHVYDELSPHVNELPLAFDKSLRPSKSDRKSTRLNSSHW